MNFFTPKLLKIRWSSLFWGFFAHHFQIQLSIQGSNLNSRFVSMSELELILLMGVLTPNFNTMDFIKFLEKKTKTSHLDHSGHIEGDVMQNHEQKKKVKKSENQDFVGKTNYFLAPCPSALGQFQPHGCMLELLRKFRKNELNTRFQQKFAVGSYGVGIGRAWCSRKACEI
jgi:hypothetical protein